MEESIEGWKEYEMEVMRDHAGNGIIVCSIENFDAMGVHTGDSITVAPAQTLSDVEYQRMRAASLAILEKIGVETGGSNVQFAVNPDNGRMIVIEMNPRVSRSSALASKATGFPIAKAAAKLAVGYTLDEIVNDITKATPACFEPSIDYCVVKVPRFAFEKFQGTDDTLSTRMKAVGEVMAIGRTFEEALGKAHALARERPCGPGRRREATRACRTARRSTTSWRVPRPTACSTWPRRCAAAGRWSAYARPPASTPSSSRAWPTSCACRRTCAACTSTSWMPTRSACSSAWASPTRRSRTCTGSDELTVRTCRKLLGVRPAFKTVDTCAAEFPSSTAYHYKTYDADETEVAPKTRKRAMILGAGPNRIGQGIEFDYCCVHASYALAEAGFETIMVNCNPETVSTDYDTSDKLYFEPLTFEDVMDIVDVECPDGVVVTLGGQTPLKLANALAEAGVPIMGTSPGGHRSGRGPRPLQRHPRRAGHHLPGRRHGLHLPGGLRRGRPDRVPRCSCAPATCWAGAAWASSTTARSWRSTWPRPRRYRPTIRCTSTASSRGRWRWTSTRSATARRCTWAACSSTSRWPASTRATRPAARRRSRCPRRCVSQLRSVARDLALRLGVVGLINIQFAIKDQVIYIIEANPRASRTVPFVSKATGVPLAKMAARIMAGEKIADLGLPPDDRRLEHYSVKEAVMPFGRFPGADTVLGPEMKSTGEVMGIAGNFPAAFAKTQLAISYALPEGGTVFISVCDRDKRAIVSIARDIVRLGFKVVATGGTARALRAAGVDCEEVKKVHEGAPNVLDRIAAGEIALMINTPFGHATRADGYELRLEAVKHGVTHVTNLAGAQAMVAGMEMARANGLSVVALQDLPQWG